MKETELEIGDVVTIRLTGEEAMVTDKNMSTGHVASYQVRTKDLKIHTMKRIELEAKKAGKYLSSLGTLANSMHTNYAIIHRKHDDTVELHFLTAENMVDIQSAMRSVSECPHISRGECFDETKEVVDGVNVPAFDY